MNNYIGDGVPDSGNYSMLSDGSVQTGPGDAQMHVIFYKRAVHNARLSGQEGRPIYEDVDFVKIQNPGERLNIVEREVNALDKRRWPQHWNAYSAGKDQVAIGTPMGLLFPRHPAQIAMLQALGIMTVEQLANASATAIDAIGMHGQDYVNYAQKYIKGAGGGAAFHQMQMELEEQKRQNDRLRKQMEDMSGQMANMNAAIMAQAGVYNTAAQQQQQPFQQIVQPIKTAPVPSFDVQSTMIDANHGSNEWGKA
jgi:hypothetical protein